MMSMGHSAKARRRAAIMEKWPVGEQLAAMVERMSWLSAEVAKVTGEALPADAFAKLDDDIADIKRRIKKPKGER